MLIRPRIPLYSVIGIAPSYAGSGTKTLGSTVFWLLLLFVPPLCLWRDLSWKYVQRTYRPQPYHWAQEQLRLEQQQQRRLRIVHASEGVDDEPSIV